MKVYRFCRDGGKGGVGEGALCLSSSQHDSAWFRNTGESHPHEDRHRAPSHPNIHPLSLQDGGGCFVSFLDSVVNIHQNCFVLCFPHYFMKMLCGKNALISQWGASTISQILRSTATLHSM